MGNGEVDSLSHFKLELPVIEALACFDGMEDLPAEELYEMMFERAHTLLELGRSGDCMQALDRVLAISSEDPEAWYLKSLAFEKQGKSAEAEKCWKRSIREAKKWVEGDHPCEYWGMHSYDLALTNPDNNFDRIGETRFARGNAFFLAGRFAEALESYEETARHGYWHLGGVGGKAQALDCCEEVLKRFPKSKSSLKLKALLLRRPVQGNNAAACAIIALDEG